MVVSAEAARWASGARPPVGGVATLCLSGSEGTPAFFTDGGLFQRSGAFILDSSWKRPSSSLSGSMETGDPGGGGLLALRLASWPRPRPRPRLRYNAGRLSVSAADTDCSIPPKVNTAGAAGVKLCFYRNHRRRRGAHENQRQRGGI